MKNTFAKALLIVMALKICEGHSTCSYIRDVGRRFRSSTLNDRDCLSCFHFDYENMMLPQWVCTDDPNDFQDVFSVINDNHYNWRNGYKIYLKIETNNFTNYLNDFNLQFSQIVILDISQNNIEIIPDAFFLPFSNVLSLNISKNNLTSVSPNDFIYLRSLQVLDLSFNRITHLPDAFVNVELFDIDLSHNKISNFPKYLFESQMHLENLNLSYNELARFEVVFPKYSKFILDQLDLSYNQLNNVSINKDVKRLEITHNNLTEFSLHLGENLVSLNLSHNRLVKIDDHSMLNAVNVLYIDLSYNALRRLPTASFRNQKKLFSLSISNNLFAESSFESYNNWATFFYNFDMLKSVDLNNNLWTCAELKDIIHMLKSRSIHVIEGNYHNSSNILDIKCIETYRKNTGSFNESESEISQTMGLDILTQVLENIDPQFKKLEEINKLVLNKTSSNLLKINITMNDMERFKMNISKINDILANFSKSNAIFGKSLSNTTNNEKTDYKFIKDRMANLEAQIKSIAAYQQNSEKIVHVNSETANQYIPKEPEISPPKNTAKLTVQSDEQVAESKQILERISEGTNAISGMVVQNLLLSFILGALLYNLFIKIKGKRRHANRDELNLVQS